METMIARIREAKNRYREFIGNNPTLICMSEKTLEDLKAEAAEVYGITNNPYANNIIFGMEINVVDMANGAWGMGELPKTLKDHFDDMTKALKAVTPSLNDLLNIKTKEARKVGAWGCEVETGKVFKVEKGEKIRVKDEVLGFEIETNYLENWPEVGDSVDNIGDIYSLDATVSKLKAENKALRERCEKKAKSNKRLSNRNDFLGKAVKEQKNDIDGLIQDNRLKTDELNAALDKLFVVEQALVKLRAHNKDLRSLLDEQAEEVHKMNSVICKIRDIATKGEF